MTSFLKIGLMGVMGLMAGCATSGIRYYEPVTRVDRAGHAYQKAELVAAVETDMPGLARLDIGKFHAVFTPTTMVAQDAVFNRAGNYVATLQSTVPQGMYPSRTISAKGVAMQHAIDSAGAAATGTITSIGASLVTGGVVHLIP